MGPYIIYVGTFGPPPPNPNPNPPSVNELGPYIIYVGRHKLNGFNMHQESHRVRRVVVPESYVEPQRGNDLALVELSRPVFWSDYVQPICVPDQGALFPGGLDCMVTGWGHIRDNGETGRTLGLILDHILDQQILDQQIIDQQILDQILDQQILDQILPHILDQQILDHHILDQILDHQIIGQFLDHQIRS